MGHRLYAETSRKPFEHKKIIVPDAKGPSTNPRDVHSATRTNKLPTKFTCGLILNLVKSVIKSEMKTTKIVRVL